MKRIFVPCSVVEECFILTNTMREFYFATNANLRQLCATTESLR